MINARPQPNGPALLLELANQLEQTGVLLEILSAHHARNCRAIQELCGLMGLARMQAPPLPPGAARLPDNQARQ